MTDKSKQNNAKSIDILLVEDSQTDIKIALRAFAEAELKSNIYVVNNGEEALDYLDHKGRYEDKVKFPRPDLILLDIKMPKMDGFGLLKKIKANSDYNFIPVIMLTSSKEDEDVVKSYKDGAASFIQKPIDYREFVKVIEGFGVYWNTINKLPNPENCKD